jgi:hypothetical protein
LVARNLTTDWWFPFYTADNIQRPTGPLCDGCHSVNYDIPVSSATDRPTSTNPINEKSYDWPVGFQVGRDLKDFWKLEEHKFGEQSFTHFADGTAHKNRMQAPRLRAERHVHARRDLQQLP